MESTRFEFRLSNLARNLNVFNWNVHNVKTLGFRAKLPSQNSLNDEILIADIKKTLGFPQKKCKFALKNVGNELKNKIAEKNIAEGFAGDPALFFI